MFSFEGISLILYGSINFKSTFLNKFLAVEFVIWNLFIIGSIFVAKKENSFDLLSNFS